MYLRPTKLIVCSIMTVAVLAVGMCPTGLAGEGPSRGEEPPPFTGTDVRTGQPVEFADSDDSTMLLLFFFALGSETSEEGLHLLEILQDRYGNAGLDVVAISPKDDPEQLRQFAASYALHYSILSDQNNRISSAYGAGNVFPKTFIIAPYVPQVTNVLVGGGKGTQRMLTAIAEKLLRQGHADAAQTVAELAVKADPADANAKAALGYSFLAQGKIAEAERTFDEAKGLPEGELVSLEGMAHVRVQEGRLTEAVELADAALSKAPEGAPGAGIVKAEVYRRRGNTQQAVAELKSAVDSSGPEWQRSVALNKLGRVQAEQARLDEAVETYAKAVSLDPYNLEALSNKGAAQVQIGDHEGAVATLETAKLLNPQDEIVAGLLRDAVRAQRDANDIERQKLIGEQVDTLKNRYKEQRDAAGKEPVDEWTSRPLTLAVLDFNVDGGMIDRAGTDRVILNQFTATLTETSRVTLVEREIIEKLLTELNLSSSELADADTRLRLGRLLSARVIAVGSFVPFDGDLMFSPRLIDTETSRVVASVSPNLSAHGGIGPLAVSAAEKCSAALIDAYPLRGRIIDLDGGVVLNLGDRHGVASGMKFRVLREGKAIKDSQGRVLSRKQETVATLEAETVEPAITYATVIERTGTLKMTDKVVETR